MKNILLALCAFLLGTFTLAAQKENTRLKAGAEFAPFFHGVASGDPLADKVVIWTRVTPAVFNEDNIEVSWRIATDTAMTEIVSSGTFETNATRDYTVKVDVLNLRPATYYYYDFKAFDKYSIRGRTKTAPTAAELSNLRFAVVSCSNYEYGYFNAYKQIVKRNDVDAVLHLGDYFYEYETGGYSAGISERVHEPAQETINLTDYRVRFSHYRLDEDLKAIHQQYPFIAVWDDHESANDSYKDGAENHDEATEGSWEERKGSAIQAYMEWMPIREQANNSIVRKINYGNLVNLYMLDTRIEGRDAQVQTGSPEAFSTNRRLLGDEQFNWLKSELENSTAKWNVFGQQVMMAPLRVAGVAINPDQWDGYDFERNRVYDLFDNVDNAIVLTGDIHTSWANDLPNSILSGGLPYNPLTGDNSHGVEFVCTSVTSPGLDLPIPVELIQVNNPHMKYIDLTQKGYMILDLTSQRAQADWFYVDVNTPNNDQTYGASFLTNDGDKFLTEANEPSYSLYDPATLAPPKPIDLSTGVKELEYLSVFCVYPNPFGDAFIVQYALEKAGDLDIKLFNLSGQEVVHKKIDAVGPGVHYIKVNAQHLTTGMYSLLISSNGETKAMAVLKK